MSTYLMLQDHFVNNQYFAAGTTQATADVGGLLPTGWKPTPNVDPLDTAAVNAFYAMGPVQSFPTIYTKPVTYWKAILADFSGADFSPVDFFVNTPRSWVLTGLGSNTTTYPAITI